MSLEVRKIASLPSGLTVEVVKQQTGHLRKGNTYLVLLSSEDSTYSAGTVISNGNRRWELRYRDELPTYFVGTLNEAAETLAALFLEGEFGERCENTWDVATPWGVYTERCDNTATVYLKAPASNPKALPIILCERCADGLLNGLFGRMHWTKEALPPCFRRK